MCVSVGTWLLQRLKSTFFEKNSSLRVPFLGILHMKIFQKTLILVFEASPKMDFFPRFSSLWASTYVVISLLTPLKMHPLLLYCGLWKMWHVSTHDLCNLLIKTMLVLLFDALTTTLLLPLWTWPGSLIATHVLVIIRDVHQIRNDFCLHFQTWASMKICTRYSYTYWNLIWKKNGI